MGEGNRNLDKPQVCTLVSCDLAELHHDAYIDMTTPHAHSTVAAVAYASSRSKVWRPAFFAACLMVTVDVRRCSCLSPLLREGLTVPMGHVGTEVYGAYPASVDA